MSEEIYDWDIEDFGVLTCEWGDIIFFYDAPILAIITDNTDKYLHIALAGKIEFFEAKEIVFNDCMIIKISEERYQDLYNNKIDFRNAQLKAEEGFVYYLDYVKDTQKYVFHRRFCEEIPEVDLCGRDFYWHRGEVTS